MDGRFGPHDAEIERCLGRLRAVRWLCPDAEMETLAPAAVGWLRDRLDEHAAALAAAAPGVAALAAPEVETVRSMRAAGQRWDAAWERAAAGADPGAGLDPGAEAALGHLRRLETARDRAVRLLTVGLAPADLGALRAAIDAALEDAARASERWGAVRWTRVPRPPGDRAAGEQVGVLHVEWIAAHGADPALPSPWEPLLALWERGVWPLVLPGGRVLVYVPVVRGSAVVPEPDAPGTSGVPTLAAPRAWDVGLRTLLRQVAAGPPPGHEPVPALVGPLPYPLPVQPYGAPMPPAAPDDGLPPPGGGAREVSWYRRLVRGAR